MSDDLFNKVAEVIAAYKKVPVESISPETTFQELEMDSLDGLSLIFEVEESFNITVSDDIAAGFKSVNDIVEYLKTVGA